MKILKRINFRVYEAERVALIADKNSGRESLINLLMLNVRRDDTDNFNSQNSNNFLSDARIGSTRISNLRSKVAVSLVNQLEPVFDRDRKLNSNFKKLEKNIQDSKQSYFELMSENVDYCNPEVMRKQILYLNQYPAFFAGTVKENIDPDDQF
jgi:ABC-type iron transport system FetAB ATPase subunit